MHSSNHFCIILVVVAAAAVVYWSNSRCLYSAYATTIPISPTNYNYCFINCQGFVISDWEGIDRITTPPHSNYSYSVEAAIKAGIDMVSGYLLGQISEESKRNLY
jgi:hypothetical protein